MRTLLVIGGEGNMTGMMADRYPDDMKGLLQGLRDCAQYKQIILYPTKNFLLPPENHDELIPLTEFDDRLLAEARRHPDVLHSKILREATTQAMTLFYEVLTSFTTGRQVILICGRGSELSQALLPFFSEAKDLSLETQRVETDKVPLLSPVKEWPVIFERPDSPVCLHQLLPGELAFMGFPWGIEIEANALFSRSRHARNAPCKVSFPAEDVLKHPRALLLEGLRGGFLLAIPRPSNMKNFSITLQTGKGLLKEEAPAVALTTGKAPKVERNWMTREEVAEAIRKSKDSVDNYCRAGRLESTKVGREIRITKASVQRYLDRTG